MYPSRTFNLLIGTGALLVLLLGAAALRSVLASSPAGWGVSDLICLFLPTGGDMGVHLLSYALMGTILVGISSGLLLWRRQRAKMRLLTRNLALLHATDSELEPLTLRLGLKDRVYLLDCEAPLSFCAGFISARIYLSRGMVEKLTPEELEALLLHERHHLKNRDPLKVLLGRLVVAALFFIPGLKDLLQRYLIEKEIAADRSAVQYQGHRRGLAGALMKLLEDHSAVPSRSPAVGGGEALRHRIDHLTGRAPQHVHRIPLTHFLTSFLVTALILAAILAPLPSSHPVSSDTGSTSHSCSAKEATL